DAEDEHFGEKACNPLRREVDDANHLAADQVLRRVEVGDLRAGALDPEGAKVDPEPVGRAAGLGKALRPHDGACPDIQRGKGVPRGVGFQRLVLSHDDATLAAGAEQGPARRFHPERAWLPPVGLLAIKRETCRSSPKRPVGRYINTAIRSTPMRTTRSDAARVAIALGRKSVTNSVIDQMAHTR